MDTKALMVCFSEEHAACVGALLRITEKDNPLNGDPVLKRSVKLRNPYVDPLSYIQVDLLKRFRAPGGLARA